MINFSSWILTTFMIIFWLFRAVIALCTQFSIDFLGIVAYNFNTEVLIAFITLVCIILVTKRNLIGALLYLGIYIVYFGEHLIINMIALSQGQAVMDMVFATNFFIDIIAIILPIFVLFDILLDKGRKTNPIYKKTDWYFKNEKYDEELKARDQREDKNEYKFY